MAAATESALLFACTETSTVTALPTRSLTPSAPLVSGVRVTLVALPSFGAMVSSLVFSSKAFRVPSAVEVLPQPAWAEAARARAARMVRMFFMVGLG
ncbi:hypothetical protein EBR16_06360 [bacterium]|nr:hypothetical protein [bacterium]